jgi:outer membrane lipoprotein SlyB
MKRFLTAFTMMAMMAVMVPFFASSADAQTRRYRDRDRYEQYEDDKNVYERHRNIINVGIGAGAGAIVGGLLGGKKGAAWGALAGGGAGAVYTYKINPKTKKYERVYRRY